MAAEIVTPTDYETGLPHVILPYESSNGTSSDFWDFHHHNFPRRAPELTPQINTNPNAQPEEYGLEDIASLAARVARGQLLPRAVHEKGHQRLLGPVLPSTVDEKAVHVIKACSGLLSRFAIDLRRPDDDLLVYMDDDTFERVASTKVLCSERAYYDRPANFRRRIIGGFLLQYAVEQDLSHVSNSTIEQFLDTKDASRRLELGNFLLMEALRVGIAPVVPVHKRLKELGMVQPGKRDVEASVKKFIHPERLPSYHGELTTKLLAA